MGVQFRNDCRHIFCNVLTDGGLIDNALHEGKDKAPGVFRLCVYRGSGFQLLENPARQMFFLPEQVQSLNREPMQKALEVNYGTIKYEKNMSMDSAITYESRDGSLCCGFRSVCRRLVSLCPAFSRLLRGGCDPAVLLGNLSAALDGAGKSWYNISRWLDRLEWGGACSTLGPAGL